MATLDSSRFMLALRLRTFVYLALLALILFPAQLLAAPAPVTLVIGARPVPFVVTPYEDSNGLVYGPVDAVRLLGASYVPHGDTRTCTVTPLQSAPFTVPYIPTNDRYCVDLMKVGTALGASVDWQPHAHTLTWRSKLVEVRQDPAQLTVITSYPVYYDVHKLPGSPGMAVYLHGVTLGASPSTLPSTNSLFARITTAQTDYETVRVQIDLRKDVPYKVASLGQTEHVQLAFAVPASALRGAPAPSAVAQAPVVGSPTSRNNPNNLPQLTIPPAASATKVVPVTINSVTYDVSSDSTTIEIQTSGMTRCQAEALDNPPRLAIDLLGASLDPHVLSNMPVDTTDIKAIRTGIFRSSTEQAGRVVVDLGKLMAYSISTRTEPHGVDYVVCLSESGAPASVVLSPPAPSLPAATGDLHGKIVAIDPGHGGDDTGAVSTDGRYYEKNFALSIGFKLRDALTAAGATVYMTREQDVKPSLEERPRMAIAWGADYYISVHCDDSTGPPNSRTGTTVYYHAHNEVCRDLAMRISNRVAAVSGIPQDGTKSDTVRFTTGFAVLRNSPMPAVLVECGYMNNEQDLSKLRDDATQTRIAQGIADGLRDFVASHYVADGAN